MAIYDCISQLDRPSNLTHLHFGDALFGFKHENMTEDSGYMKGRYQVQDRVASGGHNGNASLSSGFYQEQKTNPHMEKSTSKPASIWKEGFVEFGQNTSIHALKQITDETPFTLRRLIWILLLIAGIALFIAQMTESVMKFQSNPVSVDININYNSTLVFPAITICNSNAFRTTKAHEQGIYDELSSLFSDNGPGVNMSRLTELPYNELLLLLAHKKDDFIVSCSWEQKPCEDDDIQLTITDHGVCYTFNSGNPTKTTKLSGAQRGLRLELNVEQYEYMAGPSAEAGIKVQVHEQGSVAEVKEQSQAFPPGSHGFMGISILEIHDLKQPFGKCEDDIELIHYNRYTQAACYSECKQEHVEEKCGCSYNFDIPDDDEHHHHEEEHESPSCTLGQYLNCVTPTLNEFRDLLENCHCPHSCDRTLFDTLVSYGSISNFHMDKTLTRTNVTQLAGKYQKARETSQIVDQSVRLSDMNRSQNLRKYMQLLNKALVEIPSKLENMTDDLSRQSYILRKRIQYHEDRAVSKVKYIMEHDFVRGWEIVEERTFNQVASGFWESIASFDRLTLLLNNEWKNKSVDERQLLWYSIDNELSTRYLRAERARINLTDIHDAYTTGKPLLTFFASIDRRYDASYRALNLLTTAPQDQEKYYTKANESLSNYMSSIEELREYGRRLVEFDEVNITAEVSDARTVFIASAKAINYRIFQFKERITMKPVELIDGIIEEFLLLNRSYWDVHDYFQKSVREMKTDIANMKTSRWKYLNELSEDYVRYSEMNSVGGVSKSYLAEQFNSDRLKDTVLEIKQFFANLRAKAIQTTSMVQPMGDQYIEVMKNMFNEESTKAFYNQTNQDYLAYKSNRTADYVRIFASMLRKYRKTVANMDINELSWRLNADFAQMDLDEKVSEIQTFFKERIHPEDEILGQIANNDEALFAQVEFIRNSFDTYLKKNELNYMFFRENYLNLDVYMQKLSYEEITNQKSYSFTSLLSDIGGQVGLFIGASAISLFEIFDALFLTCLKTAYEKRRGKKTKKYQQDPKENGEFGLQGNDKQLPNQEVYSVWKQQDDPVRLT